MESGRGHRLPRRSGLHHELVGLVWIVELVGSRNPQDSTIYSVAISPDASKIVYCLRNDNDSTVDLHLIDVSAASPTDTAITTNGESCYPSF